MTSASFDGTVAIWDRKSGQFECSATLEGHENEVKSANWSKSGNFIASCSRDKSVWIWDVDQDEEEFMCAAVLQGIIDFTPLLQKKAGWINSFQESSVYLCLNQK